MSLEVYKLLGKGPLLICEGKCSDPAVHCMNRGGHCAMLWPFDPHFTKDMHNRMGKGNL